MMHLDLSGKDNMLPSGDEARRLLSSIENCKIKYFKDNGHTILLVGENFTPVFFRNANECSEISNETFCFKKCRDYVFLQKIIYYICLAK